MLRFLLCIDEVTTEMVYNETTAYFNLEGTLRLAYGTQVVWEEIAVPVVEFAVWLSAWWTSQQPARAYTPDGSAHDAGPMLVMAPADGTCHRLTYTWGDALVNWTAEKAEWGNAVAQFCEEVRQLVLEQYHIRLDRLLLPLPPIS